MSHCPAVTKGAGVIRPDVELPEVYALIAGCARAFARARLDHAARTRGLDVIFEGLSPSRS